VVRDAERTGRIPGRIDPVDVNSNGSREWSRPFSPYEFRDVPSGRMRSRLFTLEALTLIHEVARGAAHHQRHRRQRGVGYPAEQRPVNTRIVRDVCRDVRIRQQERRAGPAEVGAW
jgi:hypothetical protein